MEVLLNPNAAKDYIVPNAVELNEEALTLSVAGNDTTGNAIIMGIYYICRNPQIQQQLEAELHASFPNIDNGVSFADVKNLTYLVKKPRQCHV